MERFGFDEHSKGLAGNGDKEETELEGEDIGLDKEGVTDFRGNAARMNFLSLDCPDLQFPSKACSREMAAPKVGSWKGVKKLVRYLVKRGALVWNFEWQEEPGGSEVDTDSDWGGNSKD